MLAFIAPVMLATTAAPAVQPPPAAPAERSAPVPSAKKRTTTTDDKPLPTGPWWEKVTLTVAGDGKAESCKYQSSTKTEAAAADCALVSDEFGDGDSDHAASHADQYMTLTFERRFSPGSATPDTPLQPTETLLGSKMMAIAINAGGKVTGCKVIESSGDMPPSYSCEEASTERFAAAAGNRGDRQGFFTVRIYGHSEHVAMLDRTARHA